jgi:ATP phosphoribosyltransferase
MSPLILALPSKGRLQEQAGAYFAARGLAIVREGARGYAARLPALPQIEVRLLSASEIARALRDGEAHAGVTGEDLLREMGEGFDRVGLIHALGFGRADVVVAAPAAWLDVETVADLEAVAAQMRARTGRRLRVATKFVALTRAFFAARDFDDYRIVESLGATEGAPAAGAADIIVDITTTGATLRANHLRPLTDGLILSSQAQLAASLSAAWDAESLAGLRALSAVLSAYAAAADGRGLTGQGLTQSAAAACAAPFGFVAIEPPPGGPGFSLRGPAEQATAAALALRAAGASRVAMQAETHVFVDAPGPMHAFEAKMAEFVAVNA